MKKAWRATLEINGVILFDSLPSKDNRGLFRKVYSSKNTHMDFNLREIFFSESESGVFRGMHLQTSDSESGRIISLIDGEVIDVLIDLRVSSTTHLNVMEILWTTDSSHGAIYVPPGVAHGFLAISKSLLVYASDKNHVPSLDSGVNILSLSVSFKSEIKNISERDQMLPSVHDWIKGTP
jgi:dTDP-4-dehydrorhamnose 3,5-epimerase-like enzyme